MTENNMKAIAALNRVDGFEPSSFTRQLQNEDGSMSMYLDIKYRMLWFRLRCPSGKIDTEVLKMDEKSAVVCCRVYGDRTDTGDNYIAKAHAQRFAGSDNFGDRYLEIAETAAVGRALAEAGYGTQFCGATDMLSDVIADAPIDIPNPVADTSCVSVSAPMTVQPQPYAQQTPSAAAGRGVQQPMTQGYPMTSNAQWAQQAAPKAPYRAQQPVTLEDYLNTMTIEDAKNVVVDIGKNRGRTLGEMVMHQPADLEWYVNYYSGNNLRLKAGAILLMQAATQKAG